ncbi:amino acid ABC transporter permease [Gordonia sputi]
MSSNTSAFLYDAPGPKTRARYRVISTIFVIVVLAIAVWVLHGLAVKGQFDSAKWTPFLQGDVWTTFLLPGIKGTLVAAALAIIGALIGGVLLGVGRLSEVTFIRICAGAIVEFFRAIPMLVLMIFFFALYASLNLFPAGQLALAAVVSALTLGNAAVIAELVRAGVRALPRGQSESAIALGMNSTQRMFLILLPQAITAMLPSLVAQMIVALKDTALGYQITYIEMVRQGIQVGNAFSNYIPSLIVTAVMMIAVNASLGKLARTIEQRLRTGRRGSRTPKMPTTRVEPVPSI